VARVLAHNGFKREVIERAFLTRNGAKQATWVAAQLHNHVRCRMVVDEAHCIGHAAKRRWERPLRGTQAEYYVVWSAGVRADIFVVMAHDRRLEWLITRSPPGRTAVDFTLFCDWLFIA